jgi:hypothetical protein
MSRLLILTLALAAVLPAADGTAKGQHQRLGPVIGRQVIDAGHVLEVRSVAGTSGTVLVRWGDVDKTIAKGEGPRFDWTGSATGDGIRLVRVVAFEDGTKHPGKKAGDSITSDGYNGSVSWSARTTSACDGVVLSAKPGSTIQITAGPASLSIAIP